MLNLLFEVYRNESQALVDFWSETLTSCNFGGGIPQKSDSPGSNYSSGSPRDELLRRKTALNHFKLRSRETLNFF